MKKQHKKIIGSLGLVAVIVMTIFAMTLPNYANALEFGTTTVTVEVESQEAADINIVSPSDGHQIANLPDTLKVKYSNVSDVSIVIKNNKTGQSKTITYAIAPAEQASGNISLDLDSMLLKNNLGGYGTYNVTVRADGAGSFDEDSIQFIYSAIAYNGQKETDENDNPIFKIDTDEDIDHIKVQVYDKDGNPKFDPALEVDPNDLEDGKITIPFDELDSGDYTIELTPIDGYGDAMGDPTVISYHYAGPNTPDVPKTGAFFKSLNIAKTDYVTTGLIIFIFIGCVSIHFLRKQGSKR